MTKKATQRSRGMSRLAAASRTRSIVRSLGGLAVRCNTPELVAEDEDLEVPGAVVLALRADGRGCGRQGKGETPSADRTGGDPSTNRGFRPPRAHLAELDGVPPDRAAG